MMADGNSKNQNGFTLMELILVVAVMGIVAAIAIPSFMSFLPGMRVNGAARQVMSDLMDARMEAVKQNHEFKVFFLNNHEYKILDDNDSDGVDDGGLETSKTVDIQNNYSDVTFSSTGDPIFTPKGIVPSLSDTATITIQNSDGGCKKVKVSITGRVKIDECGS
jgi:type IV fimbrial biogenesis protein FimT